MAFDFLSGESKDKIINPDNLPHSYYHLQEL